ncbi:MAG: hypothetical protein AB1483_11660 [Candidatus Zixiibacteriota bacterium]
MTLTQSLEKCPYCRETIAAGATRCKHCHASLVENGNNAAFGSKYNTFRTGFLCGILFTLILVVLGYLHFSAGN